MKVVALCCTILVAFFTAQHPVDASEPQIERARALFEEGRTAFEAEKYQEAYDRFHEAYGLSPAPALLYNMSTTLEALGRPGPAADMLKAYLRAVGEEPNRGALEARVRSLEEAQRMIEVEQRRAELRAERPRLLEMNAVELRGRKRGLAIGLGVGGAVVLGLAVGLGIYFGVQPKYPSSTLGTQRATP